MPARIEWEVEDPNLPYREGWLYTLEGLKLAVRFWGRFDGLIRVVVTHGWLDNLGSWDALIPLLLRRNADFSFACLEFSGHGRSQHIGPVLAASGSDTHYYLQLLDLADALGWNTFSCLSHSMGTNATMLSAAMFPKRVLCITTVEGLGPLTWPASVALQSLRDHFRGRQGILDRERKPQVFPTMDAAVQKMLAARPGSTETTVRAIVPRALTPVDGGFVWTHDPVVHNPSARRWTTPSIQAIMEAIVCPVLLIAGDKVPADWRFEERIKMLRSVRRLNLKGHHHLHIDNAEELVGPVAAFFAQYGVPTNTSKL